MAIRDRLQLTDFRLYQAHAFKDVKCWSATPLGFLMPVHGQWKTHVGWVSSLHLEK